MKTIARLLVLASFLMMFTVTAHAQVQGGGVTGYASTEATIIAPITIDKEVDLNFGNLAVSATGGVVTLPPSLAAVRTQVGGVTFRFIAGTVTAAEFTINGLPDQVYNITLPSTDQIISNTTGTPGTSMVVNNFTSTPDGQGLLNNAGAETLYVGADVNVEANQASGIYQSGPGNDFAVYVNYN